MLHATLIVRPQRAELVVQRLLAAGWAEAVTAEEVRGYGRQRGAGHGVSSGATHDDPIAFLPKVVITCAVPAERRADLIDLVTATCRTGRIGDGKILLRPIEARIDG